MLYKESQYNTLIDEKDDKVLLFNTNNKALAWLSKSVYKYIHEGTCIENNNQFDELIKLGFLVDINRDEYGEIEFEKNSFLFNKNPKTIGFVIAPTLSCNMHCEYCFENKMDRTLSMSLDTAERVIDFIKRQTKDNKEAKKMWIRWFGGEPSLKIDIIRYISEELISFCKDEDIEYSSMIISNGLLMNEGVARELYDKYHVIRAQITVDGLAKTYSKIRGVTTEVFNQVISNIVDMSQFLHVIIRINISNDNKDEIRDLMFYILEKTNCKKDNIWIYIENTRSFSFNRNDNLVSKTECEDTKEEIIKELVGRGYIDCLLHYLPQRNLFSCSAMQMMTATIGPDGKLYRCDNCMSNSDWVIGDCEKGFYRNSADRQFIFREYREKCKRCNLLPICGGGCNADAILEGREMDCESVLKRLKTDIYLFMKDKARRVEVLQKKE